VIYDSHPLSLGATPKQVFIDGIPQLKSPHVINKPGALQHAPKVPDFDKEASKAVEYEGLPPLLPTKHTKRSVLFINVKTLFTAADDTIRTESYENGSVLVNNGRVVCSGQCTASHDAEIVDLQGGSLSPGLVSFGSPLGLQEIEAEPSTNDGAVLDLLTATIPKILQGGEGPVISAVDGLSFAGRSALCVAVLPILIQGLNSGQTRLPPWSHNRYICSFKLRLLEWVEHDVQHRCCS
jgi:hypothetical protein